MQTAINPALAAAMTLERAAQVGEFNPTTPDGAPTVAAQLMQRAVPPAVPQMAQQAGLASQIQAMQQQQAQQALMEQAVAQSRPPAGIERLNPQMSGFAEGGIVGYAGKNGSYIPLSPSSLDPEDFARQIEVMNAEAEARRAERERREMEERLPWLKTAAPEIAARITPPPMVQIPVPEIKIASPAPASSTREKQQGAPAVPVARVGLDSLPAAQSAEMGPPVPSSADRQWSEAFSAYERSRPKEITPEQGYEAAQRDDAQRRRLLQSMGIDPDMLQKQLQEVKQRGEERGRYYEQQAEDIRGNARENAVMNFLLSASGRRLGDVMGSAARGSIAARTAAETQAQRFMDLKIQAQDAAAKESMLIDRMRYETAMGQFDKAMKTRQDIEANRQKYEAAGAELRRERAKDLSAEERQRLDREMEAQRSAVTQRGQDLQYLASMQRSSGASNPRAVYDTINDNVQRRMDAWAKSREGILAAKDPSTVAAKRQEFVAQAVREAQALGVAIPSEVVRAFEQGTTGGANKATNVDLSQFKVTKE